ncbi:MAG: MFS transporter [Myxococcota bacterium]|nr:MFS transporter [Myxococcota bacterium]
MLSARALLVQNRDFRRLFLASLISLAGDWFSFVAVANLVTALTGRPGAAAFIYAAAVLPVFFASPFAGAVADRFDRKRTLMIADLVRVPLALLLCLAALWGSVALAVAAIIALGVGASFYDPVASAATPNLVNEAELATAQSLMGAAWGSMLLVGAGLGGLVAEVFGAQVAFVINAASFGVSAWLVRGIRRPLQQPAVAVRGGGGFVEAVRYIRADPLVSRLIVAKVGVSAANGTVGLLPAFAHGRFPGTPIATGLLFAARGLGALLGPMLARWFAGATPTARVIVLLCGASGLLYAGVYALLPLTPWFALAMVLVVIAHLGGGAQWSMSTYGLQVATPDHLRGRVLAIDYGLATLGIGASAIIAGVLADAYGEARATWWLAAIGVVYTLGWLLWSLPVTRARTA